MRAANLFPATDRILQACAHLPSCPGACHKIAGRSRPCFSVTARLPATRSPKARGMDMGEWFRSCASSHGVLAASFRRSTSSKKCGLCRRGETVRGFGFLRAQVFSQIHAELWRIELVCGDSERDAQSDQTGPATGTWRGYADDHWPIDLRFDQSDVPRNISWCFGAIAQKHQEANPSGNIRTVKALGARQKNRQIRLGRVRFSLFRSYAEPR